MSHLQIGAMIYPRMDQCDFTGPFEVLSLLPDSTFHVIAKTRDPVRDGRGLILTPEESFGEAPQLDVLVVPGGHGQEALMDDEQSLSFVRRQAEGAKYVLSVCTGALICGAAGLLRGRRATTHWSVLHLLEYFGAIPVDQRVVVDGNLISAAGVTSGIDGALRLAAILRGERAAKLIQLGIQYAPEPPFRCGSPQEADPEIVDAARAAGREIAQARLATARRIQQRLATGAVGSGNL